MKWLDQIGWQGTDLLLGLSLDAKGAVMQIILCRKKKGRVVLEQSWETADPMEVFKSYSGVPIVVHIESPDVIERMVSPSDDLVSAILGVKVDNRKDFWYQAIPTKDQKLWGAIIRKSVLERLLKSFESIQKRIIYLNLTKVTTAFLLPGMSRYQPTQPYFLEDTYPWEGGLLGESPTLSQPVSRETLARDLALEDEQLDLYGSMVHFHLSKGADIGSIAIISKNHKPIQTEALWVKMLGLTAILLLILGLGNLGLTTYLENETTKAIQIAQSRSGDLAAIDQNRARLNQEKTFLLQAGGKTLKASRVSFYMDQLAVLCPKNLQLEQVIYTPTEKELKKLEGDLVANPPDVVIKGLSHQSAAIASYGESLKKAEFVSIIQMLESSYDPQVEAYFFSLIIYLKQN